MSTRSHRMLEVLLAGLLVCACRPQPVRGQPDAQAASATSEVGAEPAVFIEAPRDPSLDEAEPEEPEKPGPEVEPEPEAPSVDPELERRAKAYYEAGTERFMAKDFAGALAEFEEAYLLLPLPALKYNIAHCFEELGRFAEACASYRDLLDRGDDFVREAAQESIVRMGC